MAKYASNNRLNLKVGVSSFSENLTSLGVVGRTGIGSTSFDADYDLDVRGNANFTGIVSAVSFYGSGQNLTDLIDRKITGLTVQEDGGTVGTAGSVGLINFVGPNVTATASGTGATITISSAISYVDNAGIATNVIGGIASVTQLSVSGVSTFASDLDINASVDISTSLTVGSATTITGSGIVAGIVTGTLDNDLTLATSGTGLSGIATYNNSGVTTFTVTSNATDANTAGTIVARDGSGNFSAGTITANLTGNVTGDLTGVASTATKLDGLDSTQFLRSDAADTGTGLITLTNGLNVTGGNVGIGTTNPTQSLDVNGNVNSLYYTSRDGGEFNDQLYMNLNGTTFAEALAIRGGNSGNGGAYVKWMNDTGTTGYTGHYQAITAGTGYDYTIYTETGLGFRVHTNGNLTANSDFYINPSGNVGIGSTQPTATLDVAGNASISGIVTATAFSGNVSVTQASDNNSYYPVLVSSFATGNRTLYVDNGQIAYNPSTNFLSLFFQRVYGGLYLSDDAELYFGSSDDAWFNYNGTGNYLELQLESAATDFRITDNGTERFRFVKSTGSLGIGTTQPTATLDVNGTLNVTGVSTFQDNVYLGPNDNMYFGTTNPLRIFNNGSSNQIYSSGYRLYIGSLFNDIYLSTGLNGNVDGIRVKDRAAVELYHNGNKKFETTGAGVTITGIATATTFVSTQTTGTAPFTVSSTTVVTNLNADLLDGQEGSYYRNASNINAGTIGDAYLPATISSDITGNAGTATTSTNVVVADESTDTTCFPVFTTEATGNQAPKTGSNLTFNSSNGTLAATIFSGSGSSLTSLNADNISSGTLAIARGGTNGSATPTNGGVAYGNGSAYAFTSAGTSGQVLTSNGASAPTWQDAASGFSVTDDTSTNSTFYPVYVDSTSGTPTQTSVASTKLNFNPSTGNFSATQFTSLSDISKKTNIKPIENPLELTKQLQGVRFDWIDNNKPSLGLIAQEVEKVLPELIETGDDGLKRVNYSNMIGLLVEAIKEQQVRIEELERKLNA